MLKNRTISRISYRAQLKKPCDREGLLAALKTCHARVQALTEQDRLMTCGVYWFGSMVFTFWESVDAQFHPDELLAELAPHLMAWPGEEEIRMWVPMHPVYFQQIPENAEDWLRRSEPTLRVGRLARLIKPLRNEYIYHHIAITDEGLHEGDRYQYISWHEDYLFSYYEEPRTNVNIRRVTGVPSEAIKAWKAVDPQAHFYRFYEGADDIIHLPALLIVQKTANGLFSQPPTLDVPAGCPALLAGANYDF